MVTYKNLPYVLLAWYLATQLLQHTKPKWQKRTRNTTERKGNVNVTQRNQRADWTRLCAATERVGNRAESKETTTAKAALARPTFGQQQQRQRQRQRQRRRRHGWLIKVVGFVISSLFLLLLSDSNSLFQNGWQAERASLSFIVISSNCRATAGVCLRRRDVYPSEVIRLFTYPPPYVHNHSVYMNVHLTH